MLNPEDEENGNDCTASQDAYPDSASEAENATADEKTGEVTLPHRTDFQQEFVFSTLEENEEEVPGERPAAQRNETPWQWRPENREPWQLHSELGPNLEASQRTFKEFAPELVNPEDYDYSSPLLSEFNMTSAREFWEHLKIHDQEYSDDTLDINTLDDHQLLFVNLVTDHVSISSTAFRRGVSQCRKRSSCLALPDQEKPERRRRHCSKFKRFYKAVVFIPTLQNSFVLLPPLALRRSISSFLLPRFTI